MHIIDEKKKVETKQSEACFPAYQLTDCMSWMLIVSVLDNYTEQNPNIECLNIYVIIGQRGKE